MVPKVPKVKSLCYSAKFRSFYLEYHKSFYFFPEISRVENAKKNINECPLGQGRRLQMVVYEAICEFVTLQHPGGTLNSIK